MSDPHVKSPTLPEIDWRFYCKKAEQERDRLKEIERFRVDALASMKASVKKPCGHLPELVIDTETGERICCECWAQEAEQERDQLKAELVEWKQVCKNRDETVSKQGDEWVKLKNEIDSLKAELQQAREGFKHLEEDRDFYKQAIVRIAETMGIVTPLQLIARAENDQENYADILIRILKEKLQSETPRHPRTN